MNNNFLLDIVDRIKKQRPLIFTLTNQVTENFLVNTILSMGASAVCAQDADDSEHSARNSNCILINIGTYNNNFINCVDRTLAIAHEKQLPVVLDPVGCGFSAPRFDLCVTILRSGAIKIIKGNHAEIAALATGILSQRGVDGHDNFSSNDHAIALSKRYACVVVSTGEIDVIAYHDQVFENARGHSMMQNVIGTGCALGGIIATVSAVENDLATACFASTMLSGIAGENAYACAKTPGSFSAKYLDALFCSSTILSVAHA